jgi:hypothetical protein
VLFESRPVLILTAMAVFMPAATVAQRSDQDCPAAAIHTDRFNAEETPSCYTIGIGINEAIGLLEVASESCIPPFTVNVGGGTLYEGCYESRCESNTVQGCRLERSNGSSTAVGPDEIFRNMTISVSIAPFRRTGGGSDQCVFELIGTNIEMTVSFLVVNTILNARQIVSAQGANFPSSILSWNFSGGCLGVTGQLEQALDQQARIALEDAMFREAEPLYCQLICP